ncbi:MAG: ribosome maturation factor RimM [Blautia sp.]
MEDFLQVGVITATHGIRGEVKVFPTTDDPERFLDLEDRVSGYGQGENAPDHFQRKIFKQFVILKFKEFDNINDVEPFRKKCLLVTRDQAVPLEEDEYFIADLIGPQG